MAPLRLPPPTKKKERKNKKLDTILYTFTYNYNL